MSGRKTGRIPEVFDELEIGITLHDPETAEILDVNSRLEELYGYTAEELRELSVADYSTDDEAYSQAEVTRRIRAAADGEAQTFEWHVETASDSQQDEATAFCLECWAEQAERPAETMKIRDCVPGDERQI